MTQAEKESNTVLNPEYFKSFVCPLDDLPRNPSDMTRSYTVNGVPQSGLGSRGYRLFGRQSRSQKTTRLNVPSETILVLERADKRNKLGAKSYSYIQNTRDIENALSVISGTRDANHHQNGFKNPILFGDFHVATTYMQSMRFNNNYLWLMVK